MRRRLTLAILGTVVVTLVVAGVGTLLLGRIGARKATESDLRAQAEATADLIELRGTTPVDPTTGKRQLPRERLAKIRQSLKVEDIEVVVLTPANKVGPAGDPLPPDLGVADLDPDALRNGQVVSGSAGAKVFAATALPSTPQGYLGVLVLTRPVDPLFGRSVRWFLIAAALTLALGVLIAVSLSDRLTKPLRRATRATARIADGDLSTRLEEHPNRTHHDELDELGHSINSMAAALDRSRGLERQFLLSISHDLRTPLTSIRGYAEAIADGAAPDDRVAATTILAESRRLDRLVRDLLELAKLDARQFSLVLSPLDLVALARDSVDGFRHEAAHEGLHIDLVGGPDPVVARADHDRLSQVVANLIENAVKYATHHIEVRVVPDPVAPRLEVADDGPGIAPADLSHVFERLYRASAEPHRKETGSGLGLAIVHELIQAMGGTVRAEQNPGGGTRMVVGLPADPVPPSTPPDSASSSTTHS